MTPDEIEEAMNTVIEQMVVDLSEAEGIPLRNRSERQVARLKKYARYLIGLGWTKP